MRDIKFRAFNGDRIVKVNTIRWTDGEIDWVDTSKNDDFDQDLILMQYTGRKDSEGNEIYEGDILQNEHHFKYQVVFKGDCWRCEPIKNNYFKNRFIGNDLKVIGNIYQNKQLLED